MLALGTIGAITSWAHNRSSLLDFMAARNIAGLSHAARHLLASRTRATADLAGLLEENIPDGAYEAESGPSLTETLLAPVLLMIVMIGGLTLILKRSGGMGSALAFARSRAKVYEKDERRVFQRQSQEAKS